MLRRRLLQNSEAGGGIPDTIDFSFHPEFPLLGNDSYWNYVHYQIYSNQGLQIDDLAPEQTGKISIVNGDNIQAVRNTGYVPNWTHFEYHVNEGSTIYLRLNDINGNYILNNPQGYISISDNLAPYRGFFDTYILSGSSEIVSVQSNTQDLIPIGAYSKEVIDIIISVGEDFYFSLKVEI